MNDMNLKPDEEPIFVLIQRSDGTRRFLTKIGICEFVAWIEQEHVTFHLAAEIEALADLGSSLAQGN